MDRSIYTAASGLMTGNKMLNDISNNISNYGSTGYKKDISLVTQFSNKLINKIDDNINIGALKNQVAIEETRTIHSNGSIHATSIETDFAIEGEGYFKISKNNQYLYTRNGNFTVDDNDYLVTHDGAFVLDKDNNKLKYAENKDTIAEKINVADFSNKTLLLKVGSSNFINEDAINNIETPSQNYKVGQNVLESSNVNLEDEMPKLINVQRYFSFNQKVMTTNDELLEKICNF